VGTPFRNRLAKNVRHFDRWAARRRLTAYRVYDRDIPEYPFVVERYGACVHDPDGAEVEAVARP